MTEQGLMQEQGERAPCGAISSEQLAEVGSGIIQLRRRREGALGAELFADPAWDMLLDLFVQEVRGRSIDISSLCMAAAAPPTTALRYVGNLVRAGLIVRVPDKRDGRRHVVQLTPYARENISSFLHGVVALGTGKSV
jgi:hypothetical protein